MANLPKLLPNEWLAFHLINRLANTDKTPGEILADVVTNGLTIRANTGLNVINYLRNNTIPAAKYLNSLNFNVFPSIVRIPFSLNTQLKNFSYKVSITGISRATGEAINSFITVTSNNLLTKQNALDIASAYAGGEGTSGGVSDAEGKVVGITQNSAGLTILDL